MLTEISYTEQPLRTTIVRIANRLNIFNILVKSPGPMSGKDILGMVGANHLLLVRLLRFLVAMRAIGEAGEDSYVANNMTRNLKPPQLEQVSTLPTTLLDQSLWHCLRSSPRQSTRTLLIRIIALSKMPFAPKKASSNGFQTILNVSAT